MVDIHVAIYSRLLYLVPPGALWRLNEMLFRSYTMALVSTMLVRVCAVIVIAPCALHCCVQRLGFWL